MVIVQSFIFILENIVRLHLQQEILIIYNRCYLSEIIRRILLINYYLTHVLYVVSKLKRNKNWKETKTVPHRFVHVDIDSKQMIISYLHSYCLCRKEIKLRLLKSVKSYHSKNIFHNIASLYY